MADNRGEPLRWSEVMRPTPCSAVRGPGAGFTGFRPRFLRLAEFRLWGLLGPVMVSSKV